MYGGGYIGKNVVIIKATYGGIEDVVAPQTTPKHLIGKIGFVIDAQDYRYDTTYPTGYENIVLEIELDDNKETIFIESDAVKILQ